MTDPDLQLLTPGQAVAWIAAESGLQVAPRTLRSERDGGRLGCKKVGGRIYFQVRHLRTWLERDNPCQEKPARRSSNSAPCPTHGRSTGASTDAPESIPLDAEEAILKQLRSISPGGSATGAGRPGRVIPLPSRAENA